MVVVLWQNWGEHVGRQLPHFLSAATLTDVTISVGHQSIKAHRIVLAFFSTFFKRMLEEVCEERPMVLVFPGVNFDALQVIVAYMYRGQVNVPSELLSHVIELAKMLQVKGLIELPTQLDSVIANAGSKETNTVTSQQISEKSSSIQKVNNGVIREGDGEDIEGTVGVVEEGENVGEIDGEAEGLVELEVTEGEPHPTVSTSVSVSATVSTTSNESPQQNTNMKNTKTVNEVKVESGSRNDILIGSEDIQLSTVDDLTATHIVKLNEDGSMGDMIFTEGYISTSSSQEQSQEIQDQDGGKKKKKMLYKMARYAPEDMQRALDDVRSGLGTLREIATRWGVPHSTLSVNARLAGILHHRSIEYDTNTLQAAKEAVRAGASYMKVAKEYNIPKSVLWRRCQREIGARRALGASGSYTTRELDFAKQMLLEGGTLSQIVKETGIPKTSLFRLKECLVKEGVLPESSITRLNRPRRPPEESLQRAVAACKDQGLSQGQASEKFQVAKSTVWRRLKRLREEEDSASSCTPEPKARVKIEVVESISSESLDSQTINIPSESLDAETISIPSQTITSQTLTIPSDTMPSESLDAQYPQYRGALGYEEDGALRYVQGERKPASGHTSGTADGNRVVEGDTVDRLSAEGISVNRLSEEGISADRLNVEGISADRLSAEGDAVDSVDRLSVSDQVDMVGVSRIDEKVPVEVVEMPLVNLSGGEYEVVGSEIVIGGQQVVVIEQPGNHIS